MRVTFATLSKHLPDEASAYVLLERLRWGDRPVCPHCGGERVSYLTPANGTTRATRTGAQSARRVWKCADCRKQFSVLVGTIFQGTKIPVRTWLLVIFEMVSSKNGVAAREIERKYGLSPKSAWFMLHRIREAMTRDPVAGMLSGTIVADETFFGGKVSNRHRQGIRRMTRDQVKERMQARPKVPILSLVNRDTGEVRSVVIPDVTGSTLREALIRQVETASHLHTDAAMGYREVGQQFASHQWVDHSRYEYVRGDVSTNQAENFFSQLKRSLDGTHHHISSKHLHRYLAEFDYRYSTRKLSDAERMLRVVRQTAGKRLTYQTAGV